VSLTTSNFAVAESTFNEDLAYFVSRMPNFETGEAGRAALRNYNKSGRTYFTSDEVDKATKLVSAVYIDCVKYNYMNSKESRPVIKAALKFYTDVLRDDRHGDFFRGGESTKVTIKGFLLSKYRGLNSEELDEKLISDYGAEIKDFSKVNILDKKAMNNEYCLNNKKILEKKIAEIAER
jgi:transposase-like protein